MPPTSPRISYLSLDSCRQPPGQEDQKDLEETHYPEQYYDQDDHYYEANDSAYSTSHS
jgi:hypothetical protein